MTPEGYKALVAERARLMGGRTDEERHKLAVVSATLESVRVVEPPPKDGTVRFGSTVHLAWDDGRAQVVRLVGVDEAGGQNISVESPLARTLLELEEGDEFEFRRPGSAAVPAQLGQAAEAKRTMRRGGATQTPGVASARLVRVE